MASNPVSGAMRGIIEGFYGPPWSWEQRAAMVEFCGRHQLNTFIYAPKDDRAFREDWRHPLTSQSLSHFASLINIGAAHHVSVGFALSPGLDLDFENPLDTALLIQKFRQLQDLGVHILALLWDDIDPHKNLRPTSRFSEAGEAQSAVTNACYNALAATDPDLQLLMCPTAYWGVMDSPYRLAINGHLNANIPLFWTGPAVCSESVDTVDVRTASQQFGHDLIIWDNYPVNDASMTQELHWGPLDHRAPDLFTEARG